MTALATEQNKYAATGLTSLILAFLAANPGEDFQPAEVSHALFPRAASRQEATRVVGTCMTKLARKGRLSRASRTVPASTKKDGTKTVTVYRLS